MGIRPWELTLLTVEEFDQACVDCDDFLAALNADT